MSLRKDTTKQRTPLSLVPTPYKKNTVSKLHTNEAESREKREFTSLISVERKERDTKVVADMSRDVYASATVGRDTTGDKLEMRARCQDKGKDVKTLGKGKVETQGVTRGRTPAILTTAGKKEIVKNTPGTSKEGVAKTPKSRIPTSTRNPVSKGVKTPGRDNATREWNVPATVARKKWDF